ncbi:lia operon protein LiaG [Scopulibacillus darangshiensis]|uniref:Lia operon protein LiaG n=1 Tax=Scopulibacillus darangshiensis TaxID=442528 RepID=A0A4R2NBU9_9BACL|nr:DUF4097 family beta strand repeat-containing protein [Scopulibacillus darangshiensis]TCP18631.1 lia operon protein LiaG [Scopulibacillus darangshiensis]
MKKIIGIVMIVCGIFILFGILASGAGKLLSFGSDEKKAASTAGIKNIDIDVARANVNIIQHDGNKLVAKIENNKLTEHIRVTEDGSTMKVRLDHGPLNWWPFGTVKVDVYVPKSYNQNIALSIGSGNVDFNRSGGSMSLNDLTLEISSGNIELENLEVNKLKNDVRSGRLSVENVTSDTSSFDIKSGRVNLDHFTGELNGNVYSGRLSADMDKLTGPVNLDVKSGRASLGLPDNADFTLDAHAASGRVSCDFPLKNAAMNGDTAIKGSYGSGKYPIKLNVASGRISVNDR